MAVHQVETLFAAYLEKADLSNKQKAVLSACLSLFSEQGFERTSTAAIAKRAGVSEGTVYKHFKSKTELLDASLEPLSHSVVPQLASEFIDEVHPERFAHLEDLLRFVIHDRLAFAINNRAMIRVFAQEVFVRSDLLQVGVNAIFGQFAVGFGRAIQHFQATHELIDWSSLRLLRTIAGGIIGYALPVVMMPDGTYPFDINQATDELVESLLKTLTP
ncbi:TetR/AcrR family transcriptional regulator [Lacticaseibacillus manihotivorans]|jgi:AcrR family transcriptional regulator|uniref:TetR family transcriptional regulator n=2 Tax=Lacticaseibacillus manihotivorans TaxID=88233 RepID=A0A0R1R7T1_9LACO|nr:TetR/AcrR family transcriptional regulator [Lacticaseibacillus manihotivorans]KRL52478.1 TetR family transcriptional regulator [Lacticaseibacillus manihotivorans DSM 13343 = JCM 12514]QFQ92776.1 TetR family transcriptional regulator [Lacticaseibacillus manihotivorans]